MRSATKTHRIALATLTALLLVLSSVGVCYAVSTSGSTVRSGNYSAFASVIVNGDKEQGSVTVSSTSAVNAGYLGGKVQLYRDKSMVASTGPKYSTVKTSGFQVNARLTSSKKGKYHAKGTMHVYRNGGYDKIAVPSTAYAIKKSPAIDAQHVAYDLNSQGQECGSLLDEEAIGHAPDLIEATATNGQEGYILAEDLEVEEPETLDEAIELTQNSYTKSINVYDKDMTTVLGEFTVEVGGSSN